MKPCQPLENIIQLIESKRNEMILTAAKTGLASYQTLKMSKELDYLLNLHDKINNHKVMVN